MTRHARRLPMWVVTAVSAIASVVALAAAPETAPSRQPTPSNQAPLPAARDIIARHVAAIGGEAAYRALTSLRAYGRFEIAAQGIAGDLELLSARPNKLLYRVTIAGIGRIESGYNGSIGWTLSPIAGPELLSGQQLADAADDAWFDATLHESPHVRDLTTVGRAAFDGHDAYKVNVVLASGHRETEYFDVSTGLQLGSEGQHATPQGEVATVNILRDYRPFGAVLQPTTIIQRALGLEQVVTISSCEYNTVPDTAFEPPAEIRALLKP
ncbi:MAG TPA: hypothetical protein VHD57_14010 [Vicinamibacterales bacterium]|jgi:hypothetical protein|nr:hypothetical protein [Vicinamibacterales bacterium]